MLPQTSVRYLFQRNFCNQKNDGIIIINDNYNYNGIYLELHSYVFSIKK